MGKPFPPHDLGGYPIVNGQTIGGDMPVEEAGNGLIMTAAIAKMEKNASYAEKHWKTLTQWAEYLLENGTDTGDQLTTDNFAGTALIMLIYPPKVFWVLQRMHVWQKC